MSHYDTLGVPRDATAADIKAAFRRLASLHHPDRGQHPSGSPDRMAEVNRAHAVLSDPEKRASYDATGSDGSGDMIDNTARELIAGWADCALQTDPDDCLAGLRRIASTTKQNCARAKQATESDIAALKVRRGLYKHKGPGPNLIEAAMDRKAASLDMALRQQDEGLLVLARALELLEGYEGPPKVYDPITDRMVARSPAVEQAMAELRQDMQNALHPQEDVATFEARMRANREGEARAAAEASRRKGYAAFVDSLLRRPT